MITKWIRQVIGKTNSHDDLRQISKTSGVHPSAQNLVDVPLKVLTEEATRHHAELETLVKTGWPVVNRNRVKERVRRSVWKIVSDAFHAPDPEMVEEITERIVDAAEVDPYYAKMVVEKNSDDDEKTV
ncbi:MAG: hypothetical protein HY540_00450 [Deltaproteobacteria bacterium]|nr:hypothetical protein [Deltaproteobacteria bacterium]